MRYNPVSYTFKQFKKEMLSDPAVKKEYDALEEEFELIEELIKARKRAEKKQIDIAAAMHTSTSMISRLESISGQKKHSPTIETLRKYAKAVGCKLSIKFIPIRT